MSKHVITSDTRSLSGVAPALFQVISAVLAAFVVALADDKIETGELINVLIIGLGTIGVFWVPLLDVRFGSLTKAAISALVAGLTLLVSFVVDGVTPSEWLQIIVAGLGAVGIGVAPAVISSGTSRNVGKTN